MHARYPIIALTIAISLACAGGPAESAPAKPDAKRASEADREVKASEVKAPAAKEATLFILDPSKGDCGWLVHTLHGSSRELARTSACPERVVFSPDHRRVVALGASRVWYGPIDALVEVPAPKDASAVWPVEGKPVLLSADYGEAGITVHSWTLAKDSFVAGDDHTLQDPDGMIDPIARHPTLPTDAGWVSLTSIVASSKADSQHVADAPAAAREAVGIQDADTELGQLSVGSWHLSYPIVFGDSSHAVPPLVWCKDPACTATTPLSQTLPSQVAIFPAGNHVLVVEEYTGLRPFVYEAGNPDPVFTGTLGARAVLAPAGL